MPEQLKDTICLSLDVNLITGFCLCRSVDVGCNVEFGIMSIHKE